MSETNLKQWLKSSILKIGKHANETLTLLKVVSVEYVMQKSHISKWHKPFKEGARRRAR